MSQGVQLSGAAAFHSGGVRGAGAKVAVVDTGFSGLSAAIASGELPSSVTTADFSGTGIETGGVHGTACAEIVRDMAPEAQLYLVKIDGILLSSTENAANYCIQQGVHVVSSSLGLFHVNFFDGTGPVCDVVNSLYANNILPVISAGNYGANGPDAAHHEGITADGDGDGWHEFSTGYEVMAFTATAGQIIALALNWDGWPATSQDYDLYIFNSTLTTWWYWDSPQTGSQPPFEGGFFTPPYTGTYYLAIWRYSATPGIRYEVYGRWGLSFELPVAQSSLTCPADASGALAVGAINYGNWTGGPQEAFSSQGPTNDGRLKPEICGPDAVSTYSYYPGSFSGTSAAAPHVAGAAALLKSANPSWTASQIRQELIARAVDMGAAGADNVYGYGRLTLPPPHTLTITSVSANPTAVESGGTAQLNASAADSYGHGIASWAWSDDGAGGTFSPGPNVQSPSWRGPGNRTGSPLQRRLTVTATCNGSPSISASAAATVTENSVPHEVFVSVSADPLVTVSGGTINLTATASDALGHALGQWAWTDHGAGGTFAPTAFAQNPTYTSAPNLTTTDRNVSLTVTVTCASSPPASGSANLNVTVHPHSDFSDVPYDHWAFVCIEACFGAAIVAGYDDGTYRPDWPVTRDQMAVYVSRSICSPTGEASLVDYVPPSTASFTDVQTDFWCYKYIEYACEYSMVGGYDDGTYHPEYSLDRGQMAVFIARAIAGDDQSVPDPVGSPSFPDVPADFWSYRHIEYIAAEQVAGGYDDGLYHPEYPVTRDQMAVFICRAFELM